MVGRSAMRVPRVLTLAVFVPAAVTLLALPVGFASEDVAIIAGLYGLYFVTPAALAYVVERVRSRLGRRTQRAIGLLILFSGVLYVACWALVLGPFVLPALVPLAAVLAIGTRSALLTGSAQGDGPKTVRDRRRGDRADAWR
jgi:hypothetical protein